MVFGDQTSTPSRRALPRPAPRPESATSAPPMARERSQTTTSADSYAARGPGAFLVTIQAGPGRPSSQRLSRRPAFSLLGKAAGDGRLAALAMRASGRLRRGSRSKPGERRRPSPTRGLPRPRSCDPRPYPGGPSLRGLATVRQRLPMVEAFKEVGLGDQRVGVGGPPHGALARLEGCAGRAFGEARRVPPSRGRGVRQRAGMPLFPTGGGASGGRLSINLVWIEVIQSPRRR